VSHGAALPRGAFWAAAADLVHLSAAAIWTGGLAQLALLLIRSRTALPDGQHPRLLATVLRRFSLLAATSVTLLLATGLFNALAQVAAPRDLAETAYGRALAAKLALAVPLLGVAAVNAVVLRPRLVRTATTADSERLRRRLSRLVAVEAGLALAVLLIVGVLAQEPTARSEAEAEAARAGRSVAVTGSRYAYPLTAGTWGAVAGGGLVVAGVLAWVWAGRAPVPGPRRALRRVAAGLPVAGLAVALIALRVGPSSTAPPAVSELNAPPAAGGRPRVQAGRPAPRLSSFVAAMALRYQMEAGTFVLLEIAPFQVGENTFRVTVFDRDTHPVPAEGVTLRFSRLEAEGAADEVSASPVAGEPGAMADYPLTESGWWAIDVRLDGRPGVRFYLRLDDPSRAPLNFAPPDYASDPAAEALFRRTLARYERLSSVRWREELTSGQLEPTGIGVWVVTAGEAQAPDRVRLHILSPGYGEYDLVRAGAVSCTQNRGQSWQCSTGRGEKAFDLDYLAPATAFRLGRREMVDGEMARVLLFYNPSQPAWYAWWVGETTGYLRRQAMVAGGHFMLLHYWDHDAPLAIELPSRSP